jgi:hypothetical protein
MDEQEFVAGQKTWTTVGSAGTLNQADLAKVTLHHSIIQLGVDLLPPMPTEAAAAQITVAAKQLAAAATQLAAAATQAAGATPQAELTFPTLRAVVRYNVTPVDGLFTVRGSLVSYVLRARFRGQVSAKLMEVDMDTGIETQLALLDGHGPDFHVKQATIDKHVPPVFDFEQKAYYVEAVLTAPAHVIGNPAAISIIKIQLVTIT